MLTRFGPLTALLLAASLFATGCKRSADTSRSQPPAPPVAPAAVAPVVLFGEGFHKEESNPGGILRWARQNAILHIQMAEGGRYKLTWRPVTAFSSAENVIEVSVNGQPAGRVSTSLFDLAKPSVVQLETTLRAGGNDIVLKSNQPEVRLGETDERLAAFGLVLPLRAEKLPLGTDATPSSSPAAQTDQNPPDGPSPATAEPARAPARSRTDVARAFIEVIFQLSLLFATAVGWGFWLWKLLALDRRPARFAWLICGFLGFAANNLLLLNLVYLDARLRWSAWLGFGVAVSGCVAFFHHWWTVARHRRGSDEGWGRFAILLVVIFLVQGAALLYHGPRNYYGWGHYDQSNYVYMGQFLADEPFSTRLEDVGLHPWLTRVIRYKDARLGQSAIHGYLAVTSLSDAKAAYGALTLFHTMSLGVVALGLARMLAVPATSSLLCGLWVALLPAVTKIHLDGFLSQASVLMVFPLLGLIFLALRSRPALLLSANVLLLGYLFHCYSEVFVFGLGMSGLLWLGNGQLPWRRRLLLFLASGLGSLLLVPTASYRLLSYVIVQYQTAAAEPYELYVLVPNSGTWLGWAQAFLGFPEALPPSLFRAMILVGLVILGLGLSAFFSQNLRKRVFLGSLAGLPVLALGYLLSRQAFPKYAFAKLVDTFSPLWVILAVLGIVRLHVVLKGRLRFWPRHAATGFTAGFALAAAYGTSLAQVDVINDRGSFEYLKEVNSVVARQMYRFIERNPGENFLLGDPSYMVDTWLAYHARNSAAYIDAGAFDPSGGKDSNGPYAFHRVPSPAKGFYLLKNGVTRLNGGAPGAASGSDLSFPTMIIRNPQGADREGQAVAYWVGKGLEIEVTQARDAASATGYQLVFEATAGPANPDKRRLLRLLADDGAIESREFVDAARVVFPLKLKPGHNRFRLEVAEPGERTVALPGDPRNLMLYFAQPRIELREPGSSG